MTNIFEHRAIQNPTAHLDEDQRARASALVIAGEVNRHGVVDYQVALAVFITEGVEAYEMFSQHTSALDFVNATARKENGLDE